VAAILADRCDRRQDKCVSQYTTIQDVGKERPVLTLKNDGCLTTQ
jgi:hypothetical protein